MAEELKRGIVYAANHMKGSMKGDVLKGTLKRVATIFGVPEPEPKKVVAISYVIFEHTMQKDNGTEYGIPALLEAYLQTLPPSTSKISYLARVEDAFKRSQNVANVCVPLVKLGLNTKELWHCMYKECDAAIRARRVVPVLDEWGVLSAAAFGASGPPLDSCYNGFAVMNAGSDSNGQVMEVTCPYRCDMHVDHPGIREASIVVLSTAVYAMSGAGSRKAAEIPKVLESFIQRCMRTTGRVDILRIKANPKLDFIRTLNIWTKPAAKIAVRVCQH